MPHWNKPPGSFEGPKSFATINAEQRTAQRARREEVGHDYENCCSIMLRVYQRCKWCGDERI